MNKRYSTIIFVPHARAKFRKLKVSHRLLFSIVSLVTSSLCLSTFFSVQYFTSLSQTHELSKLRHENKELQVAKLYDMLPASSGDSSEGRTPADNQTVRSVFVIGPDRKIKLILTYPMSTGRNFQEILRAIDSIQLTAKHSVSTPADWKPGDDVVIGGNISDEDAIKRFGSFEKVLPYLRKTKQPSA